MLRFDRKQQNSVKQLPFNKKLINLLKKKKKERPREAPWVRWVQNLNLKNLFQTKNEIAQVNDGRVCRGRGEVRLKPF